MSLSTGLAIYFIIWWVVLFTVLPWGIRSQHEAGPIVDGTDPGATVIPALRKKLLSPAIVPAIPQLVRDFQRYVQTDLSPEQINQLACLATQMHGTDVVFASFPMELFKSTKTFDPQIKTTTSTIGADFEILRDYVDRFQQGTWPDPNLFISNTPSPAETDLEFACGD